MFAEVGPALREKGKKNRAHCKKKQKTGEWEGGGEGRESQNGRKGNEMGKKITDGEG